MSVQNQCCFYDNLNKNIEENIIEKDNRIVMGGDFNVTLKPVWDCSGGNQSKKTSAKFIEDLCLDFGLIDIWRIRNPEIKRFTWRQKKPVIQRRLDFWSISDACQEDIAPRLYSMIGTQRIMCCKKLASDEPSSCKIILLHYLKPVGGKLILCCNYDLKRFPIKIPPFYEDCLRSFAKCSVANNQCEEIIEDMNETLQIIIWNNNYSHRRETCIL